MTRSQGDKYNQGRKSGVMRKILSFTLVVVLTTLPLLRAGASSSTEVWQTAFEHEITFHKLSPNGTLIVGTKRHLFGVDPRTGRQLWRLRNTMVQSSDVLWPPESKILLVNDDWGGVYRDKETSLMALLSATGETLWESPLFRGKGVHIVPDVSNHRILLVAVQKSHGDDQGFLASYLPGKGFGSGFKRYAEYYLLDTENGRLIWEQSDRSQIKMAPAGRDKELKPSNKHEQEFDLGFYHEPLFVDERLYVSYNGLACLDAATGAQIWRVRYPVTEGDLALTDSEPILEGNIIYTSGRGILRAFDRNTGRKLWESDDYGVIPELYLSDDILYGRIGGQFYSPEDKKWKGRGPFGVLALDRRTGKRLFEYGGAGGTITNLLIAGTRIYMADADDLIAIDRGVGKQIYKVSHRFGTDPRFIAFNEKGQLVLLGDASFGLFDSLTGKRQLLQRVEIPTVSFWKRLSAAFLVTGGALLSVASFAVAVQRDLLPAVPAPLSRIFNTRRDLRRLTGVAGKGLLASARSILQVDHLSILDGNHQYFMARIKGGKNAIVGINLNTGQKDLWLPVEGDHGEILVDDVLHLVYMRQGGNLTAHRFLTDTPPE